MANPVSLDRQAVPPVAVGGTGATDATSARANLGAASQADHTALADRVTAEEGKVQPVDKGGTGATTADAARTALAVPGEAVAANISGAWTVSGAWT